jgi:large subunit ribosomal protein L21
VRYAIVKTGGKQYKVAAGELIEVEKLDVPAGSVIELNEVLMVTDDDGKVTVGTPIVETAKVVANVVAQDRGEKIVVFKYKPKKRYRRKTGHRQSLTRLAIKEIALGA